MTGKVYNELIIGEAWIAFYFLVLLKVPVIAMIALLFYAAKKYDDNSDDEGGWGRRKPPLDPRGPLEREITLHFSRRRKTKTRQP